jgi:hypothetical protein
MTAGLEQLLTLETCVTSCPELCAPRADLESRETGKGPSTGPGGQWPRSSFELAGFLPALAPSRWSDLPGARLGLASRTGAVGSAGGVTGGRPAAQDPQRDSRHVEQGLRTIRRAKGSWLRAYDRFASDLRRLPGRPEKGGLSAMLLIGREYALPQVTPRPRPWTWSLASPAWRAGTSPSHDKEPSRAK